VHRVFNEQTRAGAATLALIEEQREECAFNRRVKIGVGEDDVGALTAQLEGDAFQITLRRSLIVLIAAPPVPPSPPTMFTTPSGNPASITSSPTRKAESGVCSAGLSTTVQPVASAGPHFHACISSGKFHGMTCPTTPTGSWRV
jgi:hypothetical protein